MGTNMTNRPFGQLTHHYKYVTSQRPLFPGTTAASDNLLFLSSTARKGIEPGYIPRLQIGDVKVSHAEG